MKYLLLLNKTAPPSTTWRELSAEEAAARRAEEIPRWNTLFGWAGEQGIDLDGLELDDPHQARVVRVRDDETTVTDGPFAETKDQIGGYFLAECKDLDQAIELAPARARRDAPALGRDPSVAELSVESPLPRGMGTRRLDPDPRSRRLRARRGRAAGRLRDRGRALAARRGAAQPRRLDRRRPHATARSTACGASDARARRPSCSPAWSELDAEEDDDVTRRSPTSGCA